MKSICAVNITFDQDFGYIDGHGNGDSNYLAYWQDKVNPSVVVLSNSEPFLYIHLDQVIYYIKAIWPNTSIITVTNGQIENEHESFLRSIVATQSKIYVSSDNSVAQQNIQRYKSAGITVLKSISDIPDQILFITPGDDNESTYKDFLDNISKLPPILSVIIPVYNAEKYLRQCLDSVIKQEIRNIQIICIDDGSTDSSPDILDEYAKNDVRFNIITQPNYGVAVARNNAIKHVKGKYIHFLDSDDWLEPEIYSKCIRDLEQNCSDIAFLNCYIEDESVTTISSSYNLPKQISSDPEEKTALLYCTDMFHAAAPWAKIWRADFFVSNKIRFSERINKAPKEDLLPHWKSVVLADKISVIDIPLYHYRNLVNGLHNKSYDGGYYLLELFSEIEKTLIALNKYEEFNHIFHIWKLCECYHHNCNVLRQHEKSEFKEAVEKDISSDCIYTVHLVDACLLPDSIKLNAHLPKARELFNIPFSYIKDDVVCIPHLEIDIVKGCNLKCKQCTHLSMYRSGYVPLEDLVIWFENWSKKIKPTQYLRLLGGEPFLHPELADVIREARRIWGDDAPLEVVTNGILIKQAPQDVLDAIKETHCLLTISDHSNEQITSSQVFSGLPRLKENEIVPCITESNKRWRTHFTLNEEHEPSPFRNNPKLAYKNCWSKRCVSLFNNSLYKCPFLQSICEGTKEGAFSSDTWKYALTYAPLPFDADVQTIFEHLNTKEVDECSCCVDKVSFVKPRQAIQYDGIKRILFVVDKFFGLSGGAEKVLCDMSNEFVNRGYVVGIIHRKNNHIAPFFTLSGDVKTYSYSDECLNYTFSSVIEEFEPDIIISHFIYNAIKVIDNIRHPVPHIVMHHQDSTIELLDRDRDTLDKFRFIDCLQLLCPSFEDNINRILPHIKTEVVPNVVAQQLKCATHNADKGKYIITMIARLNRAQKLPCFLISSFAKIAKEYPQWEVHIYGKCVCPEYYEDYLNDLIADLGLCNQVFLKGETNNPIDVLCNSDIFAFPSIFEGWGLALTEAMSVGLPCVGLNTCTGVRDLIENNYNGILTNHNENDFAKALKRLMDSPHLRQMMGQNGKEYVEQYAPEIVWSRWEQIITETITQFWSSRK